jgi:hypothetical protein
MFTVSFGAVDYGLGKHDFLRDGVAPANPLKKERRYTAQQEVRMA